MNELNELYIKKSKIPSAYINKISLCTTDRRDDSTFDKLKQIEDKAPLFVNKHNNLFIVSNITGNGKTTWATRIALSYINNFACNYSWTNNTPVIFINVPEFLSLKKLSISNESVKEEILDTEQSILNANLVIFDDIATKTASEYDKELLYTWINFRSSHLLSSIYTSNINIDGLEELLGSRLYSRIVNNSLVFEIFGRDMR